MIILAGSIRLGAGKREAAMPHLRAIVAATRAEPGCRAYTFAFDIDDDHLIRIFEVFVDAEAVAAHRASPHMAAWRASWPDLGVHDRDMAHYDVAGWRAI